MNYCKNAVKSWVVALVVADLVGISLMRLGLLFGVLMTTGVIAGETRRFEWAGATLAIEDRSSNVEVLFRSMRLNRATGHWEFELSLRNKGQEILRPPFVVTLETVSGSPGPARQDGIDETGKPFFDLSPRIALSTLGPSEVSTPRTISLRRSGDAAPQTGFKLFCRGPSGAFALGMTRTLDSTGHPLGGVSVAETGPSGQRSITTDAEFGIATLGQVSGEHRWSFSKPGFQTVWRGLRLVENQVLDVPQPRLTPRATVSTTIGSPGGVVASIDGTVRVTVAAGTFAEETPGRVTVFESQNLPADLPPGWSPLSAFALEFDREPSVPLAVALTLGGAVGAGEAAVLARWDPVRWEWIALTIQPGAGGTSIGSSLPGSGIYGVVVADEGFGAPAGVGVGSGLPSSTLPMPSTTLLSVSGRVTPATSLASPVAELVTASAELSITNTSGPIPSGLSLRGLITEEYRMNDGTLRMPPRYETLITAYRRPGGLGERALQSHFRMRPLRLLAADDLSEALVRVEVVPAVKLSTGVIESGGGEVGHEGVRVVAGIGDLEGAQALMVRRFSPTNFAGLKPVGGQLVAAFELMVNGVVSGRMLNVWFDAQRVSSKFVLARVVERDGLFGLEPLRRLASDVQGLLRDEEPATGDRFQGVSRPGQYVLVALDVEHAFVTGVVRTTQNALASGVVSRVPNNTWLGFSGEDGRFRTIAPREATTLSLKHAQTGDTALIAMDTTGSGAVTLPDTTVGPKGPQVVLLTPANGAANVARVSHVAIEFSGPVNPGSFGANGIELVGAGGVVAPTTLTLNLRNTVATLLPTTQLVASTAHTVRLAASIADPAGRMLEGAREFTFTTASDDLNRQAAQITSHEPLDGKARLVGTAGVAEPEVPVILENESTGRTATVLSRVDGSFDNFIEADVDDVLSATVQNRNGTRTRVPVGRQLFRDGSVALFRGGGILEAQSDGGPVRVIVEPGSVPSKTKFKLEPVQFAQLLELIGNALPEGGKLLGGFRYSSRGDETTVGPDVSFSVAAADLGLPAGTRPEDASFALTIPRQIDGVTAYEIVDKMQYENGKLVTHSPPFYGLLGPYEEVLIAPLMLSVGTSMVVAGHVLATSYSTNGLPDMDRAKRVTGALVWAAPQGAVSGGVGQIRSGSFFCTARGEFASYSFLLPVATFTPDTGGSLLRATHPRFPGRVASRVVSLPTVQERLAIGNSLSPVDIIFPIEGGADPDTDAPNLLISHSPYSPLPGAPMELRVSAFDDRSTPRVDVVVSSVLALAPGQHASPADVRFSLVSRESISATASRLVYSINCDIGLRAVLRVSANDESGNHREIEYQVAFGLLDPVVGDLIPVSDSNDRTGPKVISSSPAPGAGPLSPGQPIVLRFSEPIAKGGLSDPFFIRNTPFTGFASYQLSSDQQELRLFFHNLRADSTYTLTVGDILKDLAGNRFDQDPTVSGDDSFELIYQTSHLPTGDLAGIESGGGFVAKGIFGYALERRGSMNGSVVVYDLSKPQMPERVGEISVPGFPRDLVVIPRYSYVLRPGQPSQTQDLLAVVGGFITGSGGGGQYLQILNISRPRQPERIAGGFVTISPSSAVTKVAWTPPAIGFMEVGEAPNVGLINLQTFIYGVNLTPEEFHELPIPAPPGRDDNGDGDYTDLGEVLPLPNRLSQDIAGKFLSVTALGTDQVILDFTAESGGSFVGAVLARGNVLSGSGIPNGESAYSCYRTLLSGYLELPRVPASYNFTNERPTRVTTMMGFQLVLNGQLTSKDLALVSVTSDSTPTNKLVVLDISDRLTPTLLTEVILPADNGRPPYSVVKRDDGLIALATSKDVILLDPTQFMQEKSFPEGPHPSIVGVIPGGGTGAFSFVSTIEGLAGFSQGDKSRVIQTAPKMDFVRFPGVAPFLPASLAAVGDAELGRRLGQLEYATDFVVSRVREDSQGTLSSLDPPDSNTHYYVLVRAPGSAGPTIHLSLESLNWVREGVRRKGFLFPPVHAVSESVLSEMGLRSRTLDAPVRPSIAWRLSSDPASAYYNAYLSRPIALVYEEMSKQDLQDRDTELEREILWSGNYLRASLDPSMRANEVIGAYASVLDTRTKRLQPGTEVVASSLLADFIQGPNPHAISGAISMFASLGLVGAQNGELQYETVDILLPGRRLPIEFRRYFGGQGLYDGPFGRGWDYGFNQRVMELTTTKFPPGFKRPLVTRSTPSDSETAESRDLLFYNSAGRIVIYKYAGINPPGGIAEDPLARQLGWFDKASAYYLPPEGLFNYFVRFKDGNFVRLDPDGMQHWYNRDGKLIKVYDRYEKNSLELVYNERGELMRLYDELRRTLDVGYWRLQGDPKRRPGIDETTSEVDVSGRICRLKDYSGRDILFHYDEYGLLVRREGPDVTVFEPGGFHGRQQTHYGYTSGNDPSKTALSLASVTSGADNGTPFISAPNRGAKGRDTIEQVKLGSLSVTTGISHNNTARDLSAGERTASSTGPDGSLTEYTFDKFGRAKKAVLSGSNGPSSETQTEYYDNGLVRRVTYPEGNRVEYIYDSENPSLRSRGNIVEVKKVGILGSGAPTIWATSQFDPHYNQASGINRDFNGNLSTIELFTHKRDTRSVTKGGDTEIFEVNDYGQMLSHTAIDGVRRTWTFHEDTGFLKTKGVGGNEIEFEYAGSAGLRAQPSRSKDPRGFWTTMEFDERNQLVRQSKSGQETRFKYNESGFPVEVSGKLDEDRTLVETRAYNHLGTMTNQVLRGVQVEGLVVDLTTTYEVDQANRIKKVIYPGGDVHEYGYDHLGQSSDYFINGVLRERYTYDRNGRHRTTQVGGGTEEYIYDGHSRLHEVVTPMGTRLSQVLDGNNNILEKTTTDSTGRILSKSEYTVDHLNRYTVVKRHRDSGIVQARYDYDPSRRMVRMTDAKGAISESFYDESGRLTRQELPTQENQSFYDENGNLVLLKSTENGTVYENHYTYNELNMRSSVTDALGKTTRMSSALDGGITSITDRENHTRSFKLGLLGEILSATNANGVVHSTTFDSSQKIRSVSDSAGHKTITRYDNLGRLTEVVLPNGETTTYSLFNSLNLPEKIDYPRQVSVAVVYDVDGVVLSRTTTDLRETRVESYTYDGLRRQRTVSDPAGSMEWVYDKLGFVREFRYHYTEGALEFAVTQEADDGGFRSKVTYPYNAVAFVNGRDSTGRLLSLISEAGDTIVASTTYVADSLVGRQILGTNVIAVDTLYDRLKRPVGIQYARVLDGGILASVRYAYDNNGAQVVRQFLHRAGRADFFKYDAGYRLTRVDTGCRPGLGASDAVRAGIDFVRPGSVEGLWSAGWHARDYTFNDLDVLTSVTHLNPDNLSLPSFPTNLLNIDVMLHLQQIDGQSRSVDAIGNVTSTVLHVRLPDGSTPRAVRAVLEYDSMGRLVMVSREDGVVVRNTYGPSGLRVRRKVTGSTDLCVPSDFAFLYDGGNLIEVRNLLEAGSLEARLFYGDDGDKALAADARAGQNGTLSRIYFMHDAQDSVIGTADSTGTAVERVWYDAWGQPVIEPPDLLAPSISSIRRDGSDLLVTFTEGVLPAFEGPIPNAGLVTTLRNPNQSLQSIDINGNTLLTTTVYQESLEGTVFGSVFRIHPVNGLGSVSELRVMAGAFQDDWNNSNPGENFSFEFDGTSQQVLYQGPGAGSTKGSVVSRCPSGTFLLFHGQVFDYETGLLYCRARYYDPSSGLFLQPDPHGMEDSVNPYAAFNNNAVNYMDPTGTATTTDRLRLHLNAMAMEDSYRSYGPAGLTAQSISSFAGRVLQLGTTAADGIELCKTQQPGTLGLLDAMRGANLIVDDAMVAMAVYDKGKSLVGASKTVLGAAKRIGSMLQRPQSVVDMRTQFRKSGFTATEADSIMSAMKEHGVTRITIRAFGEKAEARRRGVELGLPQKPEDVVKKSNRNARVYNEKTKTWNVSDADIMHVEINGRNASPSETARFLATANADYSRRWTTAGKSDTSIKGGLGRAPNPPFMHGAHLDLAHEYGTISKNTGHLIDDALIRDKAQHPGESVTIRATGYGNIAVYDTPKAWTRSKISEYSDILKLRRAELGEQPRGWPALGFLEGKRDWQLHWFISGNLPYMTRFGLPD